MGFAPPTQWASFASMLEQTVRRYQNRVISSGQVITELIDLALVMREAYKRGEDLGLTEDELAFYVLRPAILTVQTRNQDLSKPGLWFLATFGNLGWGKVSVHQFCAPIHAHSAEHSKSAQPSTKCQTHQQ